LKKAKGIIGVNAQQEIDELSLNKSRLSERRAVSELLGGRMAAMYTACHRIKLIACFES
jgi:hypothetical protein